MGPQSLDMNAELPEPWGAELSERHIHSYRDFAAAVGDGIGHETLRRLVTGGKTSPQTVNKVADKLFGGDRNKVWRLYGVAVEDHGDWTLPPEASLLSSTQRDAVLAVVKAMLPDLAAAKRDEPVSAPRRAKRKDSLSAAQATLREAKGAARKKRDAKVSSPEVDEETSRGA